MGEVRKQQKAKRREAILSAALRLFSAKGYRQTTFNEIAAACGFGVATIYKYFPSKEALVVGILQPDLEQMIVRARKVIGRPASDPARAMVRLLSAYRNLGGHNWAHRELLRLTLFPGVENEGLLKDWVRATELTTHAQIRALLAAERRRGRLHRDLPLKDATAVIFALLNQHFGMFMTQPELSFERMFRMLARRVRLLFDSWRPARPRRPGRLAPRP